MLKNKYKILIAGIILLFLHTSLKAQYCTPGSTNDASGITSVVFNTINNQDTDNTNAGIEDFTAQSTDVNLSTSYNLTVRINTDGDYTYATMAWIDWNGDNDFLDAGESYQLGTDVNINDVNTSLSPLSITVPAGATPGTTRMRIYTLFGSSYPTSCQDFSSSWGEIEDYTINILADGESDIIAATNETPNIDYASYQAGGFAANTDGVRVWSFTLRDDFGDNSIDTDDLDITDISFTKGAGNTVTSWANTIRQAAIYDGTTKIGEVSVTGESIDFSSLTTLTCTDNGTKTYDLYLTFETTVTDNEQFEFQVTESDVAVDAGSSEFASFTADSDTDSDKNRLEVTATALAFVQQPTDVVKNATMSPDVTVEAVDANGNRDLDFASDLKVTESAGGLTGSPVSVTAASGLATFNSLTFGTETTNATLTAERNATSDWDVVSNTFDVLPVSYCTAPTISTPDADDYIGNVTFEGINHNPGNIDGYLDRTVDVATVTQGVSGYSFDATIAGPEPYDLYVFIDWDGDGDFDVASEKVVDNQTSFPQTIDVPGTAVIATVRMRVILSYSAYAGDACGGTITWGEVVDYSVDIQSPGPNITLSESTLSGFNYCVGAGPSAEQTFTASGTTLDGDITITAPTNYEVSTSSGAGFGASVTLSESGGTVNNTTIYVRLQSGLTQNSYNGTLSATSPNATQEDISLSGTVGASTYYVDDTGNDANPGTSGSPFATLQHAINVVESLNGSCSPYTIYVKAGTYSEDDILYPDGLSNVSIIGAGKDLVTFDGGGDKTWMKIGLGVTDIDNLSISGMTIQNMTSDNYGGGGIRVRGNNDGTAVTATTGATDIDNTAKITNFTVENMTFNNCQQEQYTNIADRGGAIQLMAGNFAHTVTISKCIFTANGSGAAHGAAIYERCGASATLTIENCLFYEHTGGNDGIVNFDFAGVTINNCTFADNSGANCDIGFWDATVEVNNTIINNGNAVSLLEGNTGAGTTHNCMYDGTATGNWTHNGTVAGTPTFTDSANDDYTLVSTSAGVDAGDATYAPADDLNGDTRPKGSADDLGCYEATQAEMIIEDVASALAGDPVAVTITAKQISEMVGFQFTIEYDDSKLTYVNCTNWDGTIVPAGVIINSSTPGKLMFVYNNWPTEIDIADGKFCDINFNIASDAAVGNTCLTWSDDPTPRELSNASASVINADWTNGCITIVPPPPTITIKDTVGVAGDAVVVDVWAESITGLVGLQWTIDYDQTKLSFDGTSNWDAQLSSAVTVFDNGDKLMFSHSNYPDEIDITDGLFFNLDFTILGGATGDACFTWSDDPTARELSDITPAIIPDVVWVDGCVTVVDGYWTGEESTEWDNIMNWSDRVVPTASKDAVIPDVSGASNNFPNIVVTALCKDLDIRANAFVEINVNGNLTVHGTTIIDAANGNNGLIIHSDATGTGSFIDDTPDVPATVESYISGADYHYISSPIDAKPTGDFNSINFYEWDATSEWGGLGADPYGTPSTMDLTPWVHPSGNLNVGQGYAWAYQTVTINYQGNLNQGDVALTLNKFSGALTVGEQVDEYQGWNFIGNPYPSAIDWDLVEADYEGNANLESALYMFDDDGDAQHNNYRYYVPPTPNGSFYTTVGVATYTYGPVATNIVPVGQGFFMRTDLDGQTITLKNSHRIHSNQALYKEETEVHPNILRFELKNNYAQDAAVIRLVEEATINFDGRYDARKLFPANSQMPQIYSITPLAENIAINSVPKDGEFQTVQLGVLSQEAGDCQIDFSEVNLESGVTAYLVDNMLTDTVLIENLLVYEFDHAGEIDTLRFEIIFSLNSAPQLANPMADMETLEDDVYNYSVPENTFADANADQELALSATLAGSTTLPSWLNFDATTKTFHGTPRNEDVGEYNIRVAATDNFGFFAVDYFTLKVINTNDKPILNTPINDYDAFANTDFEEVIPQNSFIDIDQNDILSYSLNLKGENYVPTWLIFDSNDLSLRGTPTTADIGTHFFEITATDLFGASETDEFRIEVKNGTTTNVEDAENSISIYPNPTAGEINIDFADSENATYEIYNSLGKLVLAGNFETNSKQIDLSNFASGIYTLKIVSETKTFEKLIIKN